MKKNTVITILIVVVLIVGAGVIWYSMQQKNQNQQTPSDNSSQESDSTSEQSDQDEQATKNSVAIKDFAFTPAKITVKKGTTVTWTNEDSMGHNVVADDTANSGGLPSSSELLSQGEQFTHTFTEVGTFAYHCAPHPNMKGTVEVVE